MTNNKQGWEERFAREILTDSGYVHTTRNGNFLTAAEYLKTFISEVDKERLRAVLKG